MRLCYIDESGTPEIPGPTSHYVLVGLSIPADKWRRYFDDIEHVKRRYGLEDREIHVAWMMRRYPEETAIRSFGSMSFDDRRKAALEHRQASLSRLKAADSRKFRQQKKNLRKTDAYAHLTLDERRQLVRELAMLISGWGMVRMFAECVDKNHFVPEIAGKSVDEQALEQVVSRFERYLQNLGQDLGLLIHDNNQTVAKRHTNLMRSFLRKGTLWTDVRHVIETPMFVDSELTGMIQLADLCGYALRRYLENSESELFNLVFRRADRVGQTAVGVRHFTRPACECKICEAHRV